MQPALVIEFDSPNDFLGRDHVHALRNAQLVADLDRIFADVLAVFRVAVADKLAAGFPAADLVAASQHAVGTDVLMVRVGFPMGWLASASDDDAGAAMSAAILRVDGSRQVHGERHRTEHAVGVIHQANQLA